MTAAPAACTVVSVVARIEVAGRLHDLEVAAAFDVIADQDACRTAGRQLGEEIGHGLARRLQHTGSLRA